MIARAAFAACVALALAAPAVIAGECGTVLTPETAAALEAQERAGAYRLDRDKLGEGAAAHVLNVPVTLHVVRMSNGTGGLPDSSADNTLTNANPYYIPAGMKFFRQGAIRYVDSDSMFFGINTQAEINQLKQTDVVANTVNLYFTQNLGDETGDLCGQSSFTTDAVQGVVLANNCTSNIGNVSTCAHELGHYFDLFHTHETQYGQECPGGSNCLTAGDRLCDTPADPNLGRPGWTTDSCTYVGDTTVCGGLAFDPDVRNLMSYTRRKNCRDHFSPQQIEKALATLTNLRSGLVFGGLNSVTWVDMNYVGPNGGTYALPHRLLVLAAQATAPGGKIIIKAGSSNQTGTVVGTNVTVDVFRGPATLGGP